MSKCIVVDDDQLIADLLAECLKSEGCEVVGKGSDGKEAVELYREFQPDVSFMDLQMPKYDGIYAIKNIKKLNPNAKIVIVSGHENIHQELKGLEVLSVIQKPFNMNKIRQSLELI